MSIDSYRKNLINYKLIVIHFLEFFECPRACARKKYKDFGEKKVSENGKKRDPGSERKNFICIYTKMRRCVSLSYRHFNLN